MPTEPPHQEMSYRIKELEWEILEQRLSKDMLKQSEKRYKMLYEKVPLPYQSLNENGIIIEVN